MLKNRMCKVCNDSKDNVVSFAVGAVRSWFLRGKVIFMDTEEETENNPGKNLDIAIAKIEAFGPDKKVLPPDVLEMLGLL